MPLLDFKKILLLLLLTFIFHYNVFLNILFTSETATELVSEPNPLRPLRDLQYGLGEMVFGRCRHLEYMNIWYFNEPK